MKYKYVIWDWNGTLLDDVGAALASVNDMLAIRGREPIDLVRYRECIGVPIIKFYERVFDMANDDYSLIIKQFNEGYARHVLACGLSAGAAEALEFFRKCGARQAVVSSSHSDIVKAGIEKYGIGGYFDAILGASDYFAGSKIERAVEYLSQNGADDGSVLVIGDLEHDAEMAGEIGADCVLLRSGHENPARLEAANAMLIGSLGELPTLVQNAQ